MNLLQIIMEHLNLISKSQDMCTPSLAAAMLNSLPPLTRYAVFNSFTAMPIPSSRKLNAQPLESRGYVYELSYTISA